MATYIHVRENTFVTFLVIGGMLPQTAQRTSDFFEYDDWKSLSVFTDKRIQDIREGLLGDSSGDFMLEEEDLETLGFVADFVRRHRDKQ
jgi:hypothetical protein